MAGQTTQGEMALTVVAPSGRFVLDASRPYTVGRSEQADVQIESEHISGLHVMIAVEDGQWIVRNRSAHGVYAGGERVEQIAVSGPTTLRLGHPDGPALQAAPAQPAQPARPAQVPGRLSTVHRTLSTTTVIGRATDCDLVVADPLVSRRHAELRVTPQGYTIVDLGSANGTFVNGRRADSVVLEELDVVEIGHHAFRLVGAQLEEYVDDGHATFQAFGLTVQLPDGKTLLDDVTISLDENSLLAIVGPSGAGKSTLLGALTGSRPADRGRVLYGGRDLYTNFDALRGRIGFVTQDDALHGPLTVRQSLGYAAELRFPHDVSEAERAARVDEVMEELGLTNAADTRIDALSGGQRRRVSVATELLTKPSLLFLDEPTSGLDPGRERELMQLLRELADGGRTVVVVTHSVQSLRLCDRVLFLAPGGRTAYFGPAQLAPSYFGREDFQEVFRDLSVRTDVDWSARFGSHPHHARFLGTTTIAPEPAPARERTERRHPAVLGWWSQFSLLCRRYARVLAGDRRNALLLALQPPLLGLLMLAALPANELTTPPVGEVRVVSRAGLVLLVVVLGITWIGASNAVREIVKESAMVRRERAAGLMASAYVASKATVLSIIVVLQAAVLVPIALARQGGPETGSVFGSPLLELIVTVALAGVAGTALGLLVSAFSGSVDRAMTVLPVVLIVEMLLAMGGLFPDLVDKPVLKQASYAASTQWGFSAGASTVDLERLQAVDRIARETPSIDLSDVRPLLDALADDEPVDARWRHEPEAWLLDAGALVGLSAIGFAGAAIAVRRRRLVDA